MGSRLHWLNSPTLLSPTQMDFDNHWLFHQVDRSHPFQNSTDLVITKFLETNILSKFGCPRKIITDNAVAFKSKRMVEFCHKYDITLGHFTAYYPQGNGLVGSSNKILVNIFKKLLEENKKSWHNKLVHALWVGRLTSQKSINMSPY